jgi:hypothetical protein
MASLLTAEQVENVIAALPLQGRIMLRLLLLQYLDVNQEEIEYMAADRPDPRFHAGGKSTLTYLSREAVEGIAARVAQYRDQIRHRRERAWSQGVVLNQQIARSEALLRIAKRLLQERFGMSADDIMTLEKQARAAVPRPEIRELEARWDRNEVEEDGYRKRRLQIEYQAMLRRVERERRRLELAQRDYDLANMSPLQDHEIAQISGLPLSSLAGRKVKYLQQYLDAIQQSLKAAGKSPATQPPVDLWKETFLALSQKPVQRTPAAYDGTHGTEAAYLEKLSEFAQGKVPEEKEGQFWLSITQETDHQAEHGSRLKSLFALQRLTAILSEMEASDEAIEQELIERVSPKSKDVPAVTEEKPAELGDMGEHVLKSMLGEDHTDTRARR